MSDNVLSANDEDLLNILASLGDTDINIAHINENRNDMKNTELDGASTTTSHTVN